LNALIPEKVWVLTPSSIIDVGTAKEVISRNNLIKKLRFMGSLETLMDLISVMLLLLQKS